MFSRKRKKPATPDPITQKLVEGGVLSLQLDEGIREDFRKRGRYPFGFWSGVKYILVLSVLLWWLPTLGQMIAGYVGGRKTSSPWKAVLAASLPVAIIFAVSFLASNGVFTEQIHYLASLPAMAANSLAAGVPILSPYVEFVVEYLGAFIAALKTTFSVGLNGYLVTIIFAYIGGIVGQQARKELEIRANFVTSRTISVGLPAQSVMQDMKKSATWWGKHPEKLDEMHRIPVRTVTKKPRKVAAPPKPQRKPKNRPVQKAVKEGNPSKREIGRKGYDRATVNKRLVERALSRYQKR
ncbi:MAG: hypothetical protein ACE5KV_00735 [Thermoplasmata archaeon]